MEGSLKTSRKLIISRDLHNPQRWRACSTMSTMGKKLECY